MPFTPFHFGPGALLHCASPSRISFLGFCAANVLIDVEPLVYMLKDDPPLHRFFHTLPGAALVAGATVLLFALCRRLDRGGWIPDVLGWKGVANLPCAIGAVVGSGSHIFLDCIMHADIRPLSPWSEANPLLRIISIEQLEMFCTAAGVAGGAILLARNFLGKRAAGNRNE